MSVTIRVSPKTKEALLRVVSKLQGQTGKRVDIDEAIFHLVRLEGKDKDAFRKSIGSVNFRPKNSKASLLDELAGERRRDELSSFAQSRLKRR